jgi:hypothetical protein
VAVTWIQNAAIGSTGSGSSIQTSAFGSNPTVGNYIVGYCWGWGNTSDHPTSVTFTDTGGNTYAVPTGAFKDQANDLYLAVGYAKVVTSGATFKVTATANGTTAHESVMCCAAEFSGIAASSPEDGAAVGATGTSVTVAPGSKSLTSGSLVVAVMSDDNTSFGGSTPTGFTRVGFQNNGSSFQVGEGIYAINPTSPTNPSRTITSAKWAAAQFALLAAGTATKAPPPSRRPRRWFRTMGGVLAPAAATGILLSPGVA